MRIDEAWAETAAKDMLRTDLANQPHALAILAHVATANNLDRIATVLERLAPATPKEEGPQAEAQEPKAPEAPYSFHACVFNHCPHPDVCKSTMSGCVQHTG